MSTRIKIRHGSKDDFDATVSLLQQLLRCRYIDSLVLLAALVWFITVVGLILF